MLYLRKKHNGSRFAACILGEVVRGQHYVANIPVDGHLESRQTLT
jgi:hypothetical protein